MDLQIRMKKNQFMEFVEMNPNSGQYSIDTNVIVSQTR